jgi:hypothetical protein
MVGVMIAFSYRAAGAESTIWVPISYVIGPFGTALLSIKFGEGGWTQLDRACLLGVGIGLILWGVVRSPDLTLGLNIGIDFWVHYRRFVNPFAIPTAKTDFHGYCLP